MYFHGIIRQQVPNKSFFFYISFRTKNRRNSFHKDISSFLTWNSSRTAETFFNPRRELLSSRRELLSSRRGLLSSRRELKNYPLSSKFYQTTIPQNHLAD